MQLTLKTLSLQEIWPQIESIGELSVKEVLDATKYNLWTILERLSNQQHLILRLNQEEKNVSSYSLMLALEKHKNLNGGTNK